MGGVCYDGEPVARYSSKRVKIRKPTKCDDCGRDFNVGDVVLTERFIIEGHWQTNRTCEPCEAVFEYLWERDAECLHHGQLSDYLMEMSPHDFLRGDYADYPKGCRILDEKVAEWRKEYDEPETVENGGAS